MTTPGTGVHCPERVAAVRATQLTRTGPEEVFNRLTRLVAVVLQTPMVTLTVVDDVRSSLKGHPDPDAVVGPDGTFEVPVGDSACRVVVDTGEEVRVGDVRDDPRLRDLPQIKDFGAASWFGVPVRDPEGRVLANLCAMDTVVRDWTEVHRETLQAVAHAAAGEIALRQALSQSERRAVEIEDLARTLQESLRPAAPPRLPGVEIGIRFLPGGTGVEVMGDFYDVVPAAGRFGVVIGDVCGKGAAAARTTAMARSAIRTTAHTEADPTRVLAAVNDVLRVWFDGRPEFVSALYAVFGPAPGTPEEPWRVRVAGAGHPPAFLRRSGGSVEQLAGGGVVLGIEPESPIAVEDLELWPGDALVLCTDGITEAHAPGSDRQFDDSGVRDVLAGLPDPLDADAIAGAVCDAAVAHCGGLHHDDIGVVTVRLAAGTSTPGGPRGGTG